MKTLIDIMIQNLPAGAEIRNVKETSGRFRYEFVYGGKVDNGSIFKVCSPGRETEYVTQVIASHMAVFSLKEGKIDEAKAWLDTASANTTQG